jgi:hypothetical protein
VLWSKASLPNSESTKQTARMVSPITIITLISGSSSPSISCYAVKFAKFMMVESMLGETVMELLLALRVMSPGIFYSNRKLVKNVMTTYLLLILVLIIFNC